MLVQIFALLILASVCFISRSGSRRGQLCHFSDVWNVALGAGTGTHARASASGGACTWRRPRHTSFQNLRIQSKSKRRRAAVERKKGQIRLA